MHVQSNSVKLYMNRKSRAIPQLKHYRKYQILNIISDMMEYNPYFYGITIYIMLYYMLPFNTVFFNLETQTYTFELKDINNKNEFCYVETI
jgi:hypothetical protein